MDFGNVKDEFELLFVCDGVSEAFAHIHDRLRDVDEAFQVHEQHRVAAGNKDTRLGAGIEAVDDHFGRRCAFCIAALLLLSPQHRGYLLNFFFQKSLILMFYVGEQTRLW